MIDDELERLTRRLAELRGAFDAAFSRQATVHVRKTISVLAVRAAGTSFAVRVGDLAGVQPTPRIVGAVVWPDEMLGIAGVRGRVVPVYSLGRMLGRAERDDARWLLVVGREEPIALAISDVEGLREAPADAFVPLADATEHVREIVTVRELSLPVVDAASIAQRVLRRALNP